MKKKRKSNKIPPLHSDVIAFLTKYNLTVKKGQNLKPAKFNLADLKFRPFLFQDEVVIDSEEMRKRAIFRKGNLGLADAKNLRDQLNSHPDKCKDLQGKYIVLPDTLLRNSGGVLHVACLCWSGGLWEFNFDWLADGWDGSGLFACSE